MLKYARNILLFFLLYCVVSYGVNKVIFNQAHKAFLESTDFETLVLGDSGMFLMNEHELKRSMNLSRKGSIYKVMYFNLKEIHKHKQLKNLVIPLSYSNISAYSDDVLSGIHNTEEYIRRLYPVTNPVNLFTDGTDFLSAAKVMMKYVLSFNTHYYHSRSPIEAECLFRDTIFNVNKTNPVNRPRIDPESISEVQRNLDYLDRRLPGLFPDDVEVNLSYPSIKYLDKIVEYTSEQNINLYLVRMPLTTNYQKRVPKECKSMYQELVRKYQNEPRIKIVDYMNYYKTEQTVHHFGNDDHTTAYGAAIISRELNKVII